MNCVWLLTFTPSPMSNGGYDVSDYASIHPDFVTMADFRLDKALREFEYELGRRPEWAWVPLKAVASLLGALMEPSHRP